MIKSTLNVLRDYLVIFLCWKQLLLLLAFLLVVHRHSHDALGWVCWSPEVMFSLGICDNFYLKHISHWNNTRPTKK